MDIYFIIYEDSARGKYRETAEKHRDQASEAKISLNHILKHHENHRYNRLSEHMLGRIQPDSAAIAYSRHKSAII